MTKDEMTCYNCGNKNCNVYYSTVKKDYKRHFETYEYNDFDCVDHDKWEELKVEEIRTDNTNTLKNALERIAELEKENAELKEIIDNDVDKKIYVQLAKKTELADVQKGQLNEAKELLKDWLQIAHKNHACCYGFVKDTETFLKEASE